MQRVVEADTIFDKNDKYVDSFIRLLISKEGYDMGFFDSLFKSTDSIRAELFEKEPGSKLLLFEVTSEFYSKVDKLNIYDDDQKLKYIVKGKRLSKYRRLIVSTSNGERIGELRENRIPFFWFLSSKPNTRNYTVEIYGNVLGRIISGKELSRKLIVEFNGWTLEGKLFSEHRSIYNGIYEIAHITEKLATFFKLTFFAEDYELIFLMIVLALYSDERSPKSDTGKYYG